MSKTEKQVEAQEPEQENEIAAETMHGDLMSIVLDEIKNIPDVWQKLGEQEQDDLIYRVKQRTRASIETCVRMIAAEGFDRVRATVESVTVKDGIKAVLKLSQHDPARHELVDSTGTTVYIVLADPEAFAGGSEQHHSDPDQAALTLGEIGRIGDNAKDDNGDDMQDAA